MTTATVPLGSVADRFAGLGVPVFPLQPGSKRPATVNGVKAATTDRRKVARWWRSVPNANIGIATGGDARVVVIDCDAGKPWPTSAGERPSWALTGEDVLVDLAEHHNATGDGGWLFDAPRVATPSGGTHTFYRAPRGVSIASSAGRLGPWIDVRGDGGYVVAAFSTLDDRDGQTPGHYRPLSGFDTIIDATSSMTFDADGDLIVDDVELRSITFQPPPLPEWLVELTRATRTQPVDEWSALERSLDRPPAAGGRYAERALEGELANVRDAVEGTRNHTLNASAYKLGTLVGAGLLDEASTTVALLDAARSIGLTDHESTLTIRSGLRAGASNPRAVA